MAIGSAELTVASEMVRESLGLRYSRRIYMVSSGEVRVDGGYEVPDDESTNYALCPPIGPVRDFGGLVIGGVVSLLGRQRDGLNEEFGKIADGLSYF